MYKLFREKIDNLDQFLYKKNKNSKKTLQTLNNT